uniref:Uncharacterized protein n=1 Tax=Arundo donax TaxID=35708 RepID=A0A0A9SWI8_ARUDO
MSCDKFPMDAGMLPLNWFPKKSIICKLVQSPIDSGISPAN